MGGIVLGSSSHLSQAEKLRLLKAKMVRFQMVEESRAFGRWIVNAEKTRAEKASKWELLAQHNRSKSFLWRILLWMRVVEQRITHPRQGRVSVLL